MVRFVVLVIAALLYIGCAHSALLPREIIVQPTERNEILAVSHNGAEVVILRSWIGSERERTVLISGPFLKEEVGSLLAVPAVVNQDFRPVKAEYAWLIFKFSCGNVFCEAEVNQRIKQEVGSLSHFNDWWYYTISHPRVPRLDMNKWMNEVLFDHFDISPGWD